MFKLFCKYFLLVVRLIEIYIESVVLKRVAILFDSAFELRCILKVLRRSSLMHTTLIISEKYKNWSTIIESFRGINQLTKSVCH